MNTYRQPGEVIDITASGSAISSGNVVVVGDMLAVAAVDIADGDTGSASVSGVHSLPKKAGDVMAQGDRVIWDVSTSQFVAVGTATATGDVTGAVSVWEAPADAATSVLVKLNTGPGTVA